MHLLTDEQKQEIYANAKSNKALLERLGCGDGKALDIESRLLDAEYEEHEKQGWKNPEQVKELFARISMSYQAGWNACEAENKYLNNVEAKEVIRKEREDLIKQGWKSPVEWWKYIDGLIIRARKDYLGLSDNEQKIIDKLSSKVWNMDKVRQEVAEEIFQKIEKHKEIADVPIMNYTSEPQLTAKVIVFIIPESEYQSLKAEYVKENFYAK